MNDIERKARNREYNKVYRERHGELVRAMKHKWYLAHKDIHHRWSELNPDRVREIKRSYKKKHREKLIFQDILRTRILIALKSQGVRKNKRTIEMIGCSIDFLKKHLESLFTHGMNWENRGFWGWHIDHIKPLSLFDLSDGEQQKVAFHYTNLQPLWQKDNFSKKNKYAV